uniref:SOCS box domain-containing protein n=1 Tax=Onchocerca volvulus TaxID=6282 RepID=A0A2K6VLH9_ONCVO
MESDSENTDSEFDESISEQEDNIFPRNWCSHLPLKKLFYPKIHPSFLVKTKDGPKIDCESKSILPFLSCLCRDSMWLTVETFLKNDIDINTMSDGRKCDVPDVLLISVYWIETYEFFSLLACGLDPMLKNWCKCKNGYSLLQDIKKFDDEEEDQDIQGLLKVLLYFSPNLPNCCNEIADIVGSNIPKVSTLLHLCRLAIRKLFPTSQLLYGRFVKNLPIPLRLKNYLNYFHETHWTYLLSDPDVRKWHHEPEYPDFSFLNQNFIL